MAETASDTATDRRRAASRAATRSAGMRKDGMRKDGEADRIRAERRLADLVPGLLDRDLRRRGFMAGRIVTDWPQIIGRPLDRVTMPLELKFPPGRRAGGTLIVKVAGPFATEIQMLSHLVIERVNAYFGYGAVERLRIQQGPIPAPRARPHPVAGPLPAAEEHRLGQLVATVPDADLAARLERLGRAVFSKAARQRA
ncbi:DciA family protein [Tistrella mobilis]|jgi:hypothetical protein|uniref:DUF721 domain-containing protein n=1 Tax=Tistrella mobilis TaxID=171437 RepID=UPI003557B6AC